MGTEYTHTLGGRDEWTRVRHIRVEPAITQKKKDKDQEVKRPETRHKASIKIKQEISVKMKT